MCSPPVSERFHECVKGPGCDLTSGNSSELCYERLLSSFVCFGSSLSGAILAQCFLGHLGQVSDTVEL